MKLLALDLSTTSSGYAVYENKKLVRYGAIAPKVAGLSKLKYPWAALARILDLTIKISTLVQTEKPDSIVIEEVNRSTSRISQKSLDALHFFVLHEIANRDSQWTKKISYMDSNGNSGWRPRLGIKLSETDKFFNKESRKMGKKAYAKVKIDWKVLAERYVFAQFGIKFDVKNVAGHEDICDAICLGWAFVKKNS